MKEVADYIRRLPREERIIIYGDEDIDGISSSIIIKESLERLGFSKVENVFCLKEKEGRGFSIPVLQFLRKDSIGTIILVDLGISDVEAIHEAKNLGFTVIIVDHHEPPLTLLPPANLIINPKQPTDNYVFKQLAAAGLCYHLSCWMLHGDPDFDVLERRFVELAGIATIADMMPLEHDNIDIVDKTICILEETTRPSLRACLNYCYKDDITLKEAIHRIITILNASSVNNQRVAESFILLTEDNHSKILKLIKMLEKKAVENVALRTIITDEAKQRLSEDNLPEIIFMGDKDWPRRAVASVAARLADVYRRPVFIYSQGDTYSYGSARAPKGIDCVALMHACSHCLIDYGGHPPAAGFGIDNKDLQKFRLCLLENYNKLHG